MVIMTVIPKYIQFWLQEKPGAPAKVHEKVTGLVKMFTSLFNYMH